MSTARSLAGTWQAQVARPRETSAHALHCTEDGMVFIDTGAAGTWTMTRPGHFTLRLAEPLVDDDGMLRGWVRIDQHAVRSGSAFDSTGTSVVHGYDGTARYEARVHISAKLRLGRG